MRFDTDNTREVRKLHPAAMLIGAVKSLRRWISTAAIPGVVVIFSSGLDFLTITLIVAAVVALVVFSVLWGFLSWRATTYDLSLIHI